MRQCKTKKQDSDSGKHERWIALVAASRERTGRNTHDARSALADRENLDQEMDRLMAGQRGRKRSWPDRPTPTAPPCPAGWMMDTTSGDGEAAQEAGERMFGRHELLFNHDWSEADSSRNADGELRRPGLRSTIGGAKLDEADTSDEEADDRDPADKDQTVQGSADSQKEDTGKGAIKRGRGRGPDGRHQ